MALSKTKVGILRGGPSSEFEVSLQSGAAIHSALGDAYEPLDIFISEDGTWHARGVVREPSKILHSVDVIINALHGEYGEDGQVQRLLERHAVPYTGSGPFASALSISKTSTKKLLAESGIKLPRHFLVAESSDYGPLANSIFRTMPAPYIIKPVGLGSSVGVTLVRDYPSLGKAVAEAVKKYGQVFVEEYIEGREATCGVIDDFRGEQIYPLLPIEIVPPKGGHGFFDYDTKYSDQTIEHSPGRFSVAEKKALQSAAQITHKTLGLRHYSRSDFIVHPRKGVYFLEVNSLPGMTKSSLFPKSLEAIGCSLSHFWHHVISLARSGK